MKKINSHFKRILKIFFICLLLNACTQEDRQNEAFLTKISDALAQSDEQIPFDSVTNFKWDRVCMFQNDDSVKYAAYDEYITTLRSEYKNAEEIKRDIYTNIFLFSHEGNAVQSFGFVHPRVKVRSMSMWLTVKQLYPRADETMFCGSRENLILKLSPEDKSVFITDKADKG